MNSLTVMFVLCLAITGSYSMPDPTPQSSSPSSSSSAWPSSSTVGEEDDDSEGSTVQLDMDCHKTGKPAQHHIGEPHDMSGMDTPAPGKIHPIEKRSVKGGDIFFDVTPSTPNDTYTEVTVEPFEKEDEAFRTMDLPSDICQLATLHPSPLDLSIVPEIAAEIDPMNFTISGYPCVLRGFSRVTPMHTDCADEGDHTVFHGHFVYDEVHAECDCGHNMTEFRWMVQVNVTQTSLHLRVHKHSNGKFMYFYDPETYSHYTEVDAPIGKAHQIQNFLELFHHELRSHFEMAFAHMAQELMELVTYRWK